MSRLLRASPLALCALVWAGCYDSSGRFGPGRTGSDEGPATLRDGGSTGGGSGSRDRGVVPPDLGVPIDSPDRVVQTLPEDGTRDVLPEANLLIVFSTGMDPASGTVVIEPGGLTLFGADGLWLRSSDLYMNPMPDFLNVAVLLDLPGALEAGVEYTVTVRQDFRDAAGVVIGPRPIDSLQVFRFTVRDE